VITDTLGFLLGVMVGPASDLDGQRLPDLLQRLLGKVPRLKVIFADSDYEGFPGSLEFQAV
jgi:putative transposase